MRMSSRVKNPTPCSEPWTASTAPLQCRKIFSASYDSTRLVLCHSAESLFTCGMTMFNDLVFGEAGLRQVTCIVRERQLRLCGHMAQLRAEDPAHWIIPC